MYWSRPAVSHHLRIRKEADLLDAGHNALDENAGRRSGLKALTGHVGEVVQTVRKSG